MSKFIFSLICLFLSVSIQAETVYKNTNADGSVTFTDQPSKESEEVKVREPTSFSPPRLPSLKSFPNKPKSINYEVTIIEPKNDSTIIGVNSINVLVSVSPALPVSLKFRYQLGSQTMDSHSQGVSLENVVRGTHTLSVSVINSQGEVVSGGASSTIHMKRFFKKPKP